MHSHYVCFILCAFLAGFFFNVNTVFSIENIVPFETRLENQLGMTSVGITTNNTNTNTTNSSINTASNGSFNNVSNQDSASALSSDVASFNSIKNDDPKASSFVNDPSILDMPRNATVQQIQVHNSTIGQLYNNTIMGIEISSQQTKQNLSEIQSILK